MNDFTVPLDDFLKAIFEVYYQVFNLLVLFHSFKKYVFMHLVNQFLEHVDPVLELVGAAIVEALVIGPPVEGVDGGGFARVVQTLRLVVLGGLHLFEHPDLLLLRVRPGAEIGSHLLLDRML